MWQEAMALAASAELPWYRIQAFTGIAQVMETDPRWREAVEAAIVECESAQDAYVAVGGAAWPISVLIRHNEFNRATQAAQTAISRVSDIQHQGSMAAAVLTLWMGAYPLGREICDRIVAPLLKAAEQDDAHWRVGACVRYLVQMIAHADREAARRFVDALPHGKARRGAELAFESGYTCPPRSVW